jgi:hypothetical protein
MKIVALVRVRQVEQYYCHNRDKQIHHTCRHSKKWQHRLYVLLAEVSFLSLSLSLSLSGIQHSAVAELPLGIGV